MTARERASDRWAGQEPQHAAWRCAVCGRHHPIPSLARACETQHDDDRSST